MLSNPSRISIANSKARQLVAIGVLVLVIGGLVTSNIMMVKAANTRTVAANHRTALKAKALAEKTTELTSMTANRDSLDSDLTAANTKVTQRDAIAKQLFACISNLLDAETASTDGNSYLALYYLEKTDCTDSWAAYKTILTPTTTSS